MAVYLESYLSFSISIQVTDVMQQRAPEIGLHPKSQLAPRRNPEHGGLLR
jgi:hypothetical protein